MTVKCCGLVGAWCKIFRRLEMKIAEKTFDSGLLPEINRSAFLT
jgi:hypothetical protein